MQIKVTAGAGRNEIIDFTGGILRMKIAAPPEKGKANREIIDFLSEALGVKKSSVAIVKGQTGRDKLVSVEGFSPEEIIKKLSV